MKKNLLKALTTVLLLLISILNFAQAPNLGATSSFAIFTAAGEVSNTGPTLVTGDVGTNGGAFNDFPPGIIIGQIHVTDAVSAQAAIDVAIAFGELSTLTCGSVLGTTLGNNQVLTPNIYCLGAASTLNGNLTLDGEGDPNAIFIFIIDGALSTSTFSNVFLINSASLCNVYWRVNGAFELGDFSVFRGTVIANGAISLLEGSSLFGRGLSTAGAISLHNNMVTAEMEPTASIISAGGSTILCAGDNVILSGNNGGTWSDGSTTPSITVTTAGDYFVTNTTGCGSVTSNHILVTEAPALAVSCPGDLTIGSCLSQTDVNAAFLAWRNQFIVTSPGSAPTVSDLTQFAAPQNCGGSVTIVYAATNDSCQPDVSCSATFTVTDAPALAVSCPGDMTIGSCMSQTDVDAAFLAWRNQFVVTSSGCSNPTVTDLTQFAPPQICGGSVTIDFLATNDLCNPDVNCSATFTVTDAPALTVSCPGDMTIGSCMSQTDVDAAFLAWRNKFVITSSGCAPTATDLTQFLSPQSCGGSVTIVYAATNDLCQPDVSCSSTFTVTDAPALTVSCPGDMTIGSCMSQADVDAAFLAWRNQFVVTSSGCSNPTVTDLTQFAAPQNCGGSVTIVYAATNDLCNPDVNCFATFTITDAPALAVSCPGDMTIGSCMSQTDVDAAFLVWRNQFVVTSSGCSNPTVTDLTQFAAPQNCGGSVTIVYAATNDLCNPDVNCFATFTITDAPALAVSCPGDMTIGSCMSQTDVDAAFLVWRNQFVVTSSGCSNPTVTDLTQFAPPQSCGGSVTIVYAATNDSCQPDVSCSATFPITEAPALAVSCPGDMTIGSCMSQADVDAAFLAWRNQFVVTSLGCGNPTFTDLTQFSAPQICGGSVTIVYAATNDLCQPDVSCSATFTVTDAPVLALSCPGDISVANCLSQDAVNAAFLAWRNQFVVTSTGCSNPTVTDLTQFSPPLACGGSVTIAFSATNDLCNPDVSCMATFKVPFAPALAVSCPGDISVGNCLSQNAVNAAFLAWRNQFIVTSPGCDPTVTDLTQFSPPLACGGSVTIVFAATNDLCNPDVNCSATFTITDAPALAVSCPGDMTIGSCMSQADVDAAFLSWRNQFIVTSPGCDAVVTDLTQFSAPLTCGGSVTIDFSATNDLCNPDVNCSATFTVTADDEAPVITCGNGDGETTLDLGCNPTSLPSVQFIMDNYVSVSDNCNYTIILLDAPVANSECSFNQTYKFTAFDDCGNMALEQCNIMVSWTEDTDAPEIVCGIVEPLGCNPGTIPTAQNLIENGTVTASDNCSAEVVVVGNADIIVNGCEYSQTYRYKAVDQCGNESGLCYVTVTWQEDDVLPVLTCPADIAIECTASTNPSNTGGWPTVTDYCTSGLAATYTDVIVNGDCEGEFEIHRTWTATDNCNNTGSCVQNIKVTDNTPPVILPVHPDLVNIPNGSNITVECQILDPDWDPFIFDENDVTATDECSSVTITMTEVLVEEGCVEDGVYLGFVSRWKLMWIATDACGNSAEYSFTMTVIDETPPIFTNTPGDLVGTCYDIPYFDMVEATDNCSNVELTFVDSELPGECAGEVFIIRVWTATDYCGNASTYTQTIHLIDEEPPTIYFHEPEMEGYTNGQVIYVDCDDLNTYLFNEGAAFGIDNCDYSPEVTYDFQIFNSGNCDADGWFTKVITTWTATDDCGNSAVFSLTILAVDNTPPVFTFIPTNVCTSLGNIPAAGLAKAIDHCSTVVIEFVEFPMEACDDGNVIERHWIATDDCGNTSTAVQLIIIGDETGPTISISHEAFDGVPDGGTVLLKANCNNTSLVPDLESYIELTDDCSIGMFVNLSYELMSEGDCITDGYLKQYKMVIEAKDGCGNHTILQYVVNIVDTEAPVFLNAVAVLYLSCNEALPELTAEDGCSEVTVEVTQNADYDLCSDGTPLVRVWTATDECGNSTTFDQVIHFNDNTGPVLVDVPDDACGLPGELPDVTAYDECSGTAPQITLTETIENGPCGSTTVRTWTATDACGNATSESQYFFNEDSEAPQISFNHPDLAGAVDGDLLSFDCIDLNFLATDITATDNCTDDIDIQLDIVLLNSGDCSILGYFEKYNYTWTATDVCGNSTSITLTFETKDIDAPGIFFVPDDLTLYCYEGPLPVADDVAAFDNCSDLEFGMTVDTIVISPIKTIVIRTWKAVDACGNTAVETQTITLLETEISCSFPDAPDYIYCQSFNNTLTVVVEGGFGPYTYDWSLIDCDGIITAGFWTETVTYISGLTPMTFGVTVTDVNGCETYCTITIECMKKYGENSETHFDVAEGSVPETLTLNNGKIKLAPNPANDIIYLGFEGFDRQEKVEVFITNIYGQIIERMVFVEIPVSVLLINTSNYPDGLYSVFVRQENQKPVESKFIVTH